MDGNGFEDFAKVAERIESAMASLSAVDLSPYRMLRDLSMRETETQKNLARLDWLLREIERERVTPPRPATAAAKKNRSARLPRLWSVIEEHLSRTGQKQCDFAAAANVIPRTIRRVRDGDGQPSEPTVRGIAKAMGITPAELRRRAGLRE